MLDVFGFLGGIDWDINVCNDKMVEEVPEDFINERLEDRRRIEETKWQDLVFIVVRMAVSLSSPSLVQMMKG